MIGALAAFGATTVGTTLVLGGTTATAGTLMKTKTPSWNDFRSEKRRQLKEAHPELSEKELMREVSRLWKEEGHSLASKTSNTRKNTEASMPRNRAKLEIPLITETRPDEAAGWDVAEGLFDGLMARGPARTVSAGLLERPGPRSRPA